MWVLQCAAANKFRVTIALLATEEAPGAKPIFFKHMNVVIDSAGRLGGWLHAILNRDSS
jgi:hypothetical protein